MSFFSVQLLTNLLQDIFAEKLTLFLRLSPAEGEVWPAAGSVEVEKPRLSDGLAWPAGDRAQGLSAEGCGGCLWLVEGVRLAETGASESGALVHGRPGGLGAQVELWVVVGVSDVVRNGQLLGDFQVVVFLGHAHAGQKESGLK
ncbi:hypothetical protein AVEN_188563-1 [Araneus ventricosus]|uniref:Uncharacterized protein n=1 Tax=Araneus ventricosus TaxID=182803 RepID=A0A4Y2USP6_ARAVE|nr:hypothetical protein AVEN_188563-1 [Araneus ventricosus]